MQKGDIQVANWDERILSAANKLSKGIEKGAEYIASKAVQQPAVQSVSQQANSAPPPARKKCPSCGHVVSSIDLFCPACGSSLEDMKASSAAQVLANNLNAIDSQKEGIIRNFIRTAQDKVSEKATQKAQMIKAFPVPNNKKDLLEFIHMAASNINVGILLGTSNPGLDADALRSEKLLSQTWLDKMETIYQKAKTLLTGDADMSKIEAVYQAKKTEIERIKEELRKKQKKGNVGLLLSVVVFILAIVATAFFGIKSEQKKTDDLEALVTEIRQDIADGNYNEALLKTNRIRLKDGSTEEEIKWDQTRDSLVREIENARDGK